MLNFLDNMPAFFAADALNRQHNRARGLKNWWLGQQATSGGASWYDLAGVSTMALTGMTGAAVSGWRGSARPGGQVHVLFDGVASKGDATSPTFATGYGTTLLGWVLTSGAAQKGAFFSLNGGGGAGGMTVGIGTVDIDTAGTNMCLLWDEFRHIPTSFVITAGWHRIGMVTTFAGMPIVYCDGQLVYSDVSGASRNTGSGRISVGYDSESGTRPFGGSIDDVMLYNRELTALDFWADYEGSIAGNPGLLNRVPTRMLASASAPVVGAGVLQPVLSMSAGGVNTRIVNTVFPTGGG